MSANLLIRDESLSGELLREWMLEVLTDRITVRELIRSRVYQEVQDYNLERNSTFRGLVQPEAATEERNSRTRRPLDWKPQFERAIEAFERLQLLVLIDDRQVERLDEEIAVGPDSCVTFLRMTLLVGG